MFYVAALLILLACLAGAAGTLAGSFKILGKTFTNNRTVEADQGVVIDPSLAAAKTGTLTTRTSDTAGTLTMDPGHGFTDGQIIDIYWADGQCTSATIGTVATNSVPFTGATGDVLPLVSTEITAMVQHDEGIVCVDSDLAALAVGCGQTACSVTLRKDDDSVIGVVRVPAGLAHFVWDDDSGVPIPISDDLAKISITHGASTGAKTVTVTIMKNN